MNNGLDASTSANLRFCLFSFFLHLSIFFFLYLLLLLGVFRGLHRADSLHRKVPRAKNEISGPFQNKTVTTCRFYLKSQNSDFYSDLKKNPETSDFRIRNSKTLNSKFWFRNQNSFWISILTLISEFWLFPCKILTKLWMLFSPQNSNFFLQNSSLK